jgi:hypothetical protein
MLERNVAFTGELMRVPREGHDLSWLRKALQAAVELELSTIPPYLFAMWSIDATVSPVTDLILNIVLEEMGHMGLACNMLTAVGGAPDINTPTAVPTYPGSLPGGVHPGLTVGLAPLSQEVLETFMEIELPESGPRIYHRGVEFPTIGAFYDAILAAFHQLPAGTITSRRQLEFLGDPVELFKIGTLDDAVRAIQEIKQQGEGTSQSPIGDPDDPAAQDNLAHYYKFAEIYHGRKLTKVGNEYRFEGAEILFPAIHRVRPVPPEGYPVESRAFDDAYTALLGDLQTAWNSDAGDLGGAIGAMGTWGISPRT